jgi:hypothetical protein
MILGALISTGEWFKKGVKKTAALIAIGTQERGIRSVFLPIELGTLFYDDF